MAFAPTSGVGSYVGTPRPPRRPYTRTPVGPARPPDVRDVASALRRGTTSNIGPSRPPDVPTAATAVPAVAPPQAPAQPSAAAAANAAGAQADGLEAYLAGITDPQERAYVAAQIGPKIAALRAQQ